MISLIGYRNKRTVIGDIVLDATLERHHLYQNEVSRYPIESGGTIADHIRQMPEVLTITGHFASRPIRILRGQISPKIDPTGMNRIREAHDRLLAFAGYNINASARNRRSLLDFKIEPFSVQDTDDLQNLYGTPILINVVTGLRVYRNMVITKLEFPEKRGELEFTMVLEPIQYVTHELTTSKFVDIPEVVEDVKKKAESTVDVKGKRDSYLLQFSKDSDGNISGKNIPSGVGKAFNNLIQGINK